MPVPPFALPRCNRKTAIRVGTILCLVALVEIFGGSMIAGIAGLTIAFIAVVETLQVGQAVEVLRAIAAGDRFVAFPKHWLESPSCAEIAAAGERMRTDLIDADAAIADQRRMLAEARIRRDGAVFFTSRFHVQVSDAFQQFSERGDEICATVDDLNTHNAGLLRDARSVSAAVTGTAADVRAVSEAASDIAEVVAATARQIAAAEAETRATSIELRRARDTIGHLKQAAHEISAILGVIRSVATQTSLLALNATIEAARAGEAGRGFAIVAGEVKALATKTADATNTIRQQISAIQGAVEDTSGAIDSIMARVDSLNLVHNAFTTSIADSTSAIERIGANAGTVVTRVSDAMPDLASGVGEIETAGRSVLQNARRLMARSEVLVDSFRSYFEDLTSGAIKVGILHSLSGTVTSAERPLHDLLIGLIEETNRSGGLLGRPLEAMVVNPRAEPKAYADGARRLLDSGAVAIFGCWTSQSRIETIPVVAEGKGLLFYPSQYEGNDASPYVVYTGGTPQQQAWPAVDFLVGLGRSRFVLIGHESIYTLGTHDMLRRYVPEAGAAIVGEIRLPSGRHVAWPSIVAKIARLERGGPTAIISTLSGDASVPFFRELARQGIEAKRMPTLSLSIGEPEMASLDAGKVAGNYVAWNYLHRVDNPQNRSFVDHWRRIIGDPGALTNDSLVATFLSFSLWKNAVERAGRADPVSVRAALAGSTIHAPSGFEVVLTADQHLMMPAFVGQIGPDGSIEPVWTSRGLLPPGGGGARELRRAAA